MAACTCQDWRENIDKIDGPMQFHAARFGTGGYDGVPWAHCPWCAEPLPPAPDDASPRPEGASPEGPNP